MSRTHFCPICMDESVCEGMQELLLTVQAVAVYAVSGPCASCIAK